VIGILDLPAVRRDLPNGHPPHGLGLVVRARSPLRISFVGGGTDLAHWYDVHGGAVLMSTINRYAHVSLYPRDDRQVHIHSLSLDNVVQYHLDERPVYNGVMDLVKAAIHRLGTEKGMTLHIRTDAPPGSGLGGSSALTSAVIGAVATYINKPLNKYELAALNHAVERVDLAIAGGKQDQYGTTFGGFNLLEFFHDRIVVNALRIEPDIVHDLEEQLLLCYTGRARAHLGLIDRQVQLYQEGRLETIAGMQRLVEMVYEMKEALVVGNLHAFGRMLNEAYINKKRMNPDITTGTIADALYEEALKQGALGGKLLGAGGGGYLLLYCEVRKQPAVRRALEAIGGQFIDFQFEAHGLQQWRSHSTGTLGESE
jgi:D-glycero-alpha-D-manno-heptose-7-phosphate kinase